jgi:hypothetical protein
MNEFDLTYRRALLERLETGLALLALLPRRWLAGGLIGLVALWLGVSLLLNLHARPAELEIYNFGSSAMVAASNAVPRPPTPVNPASVSTSSSSSNSVLHAPTISPAKIEAVLKQYNSPAAGSAQAFYSLGQRYGIDPAYALAFFIHESSAGTQGVAAITRSIGNIRCTPGYDCYQTNGNGSFRRYSSWEAGIEDWYKLIKDLYISQWKLLTLEQIIPVYAPSADRNNPASYIQHVASLVASWQKS